MRKSPIHSLIFSFSPIIFLYLHNIKDTHIPIYKLILYSLCAIAFSLILLTFLYFILRNKFKASIITSSFFCLLFYFPFYNKFAGRFYNFSEFFAIIGLLILSYVIFTIIYLIILKTQKDLQETVYYLNTLSIALLVVIVASGAYPLFFSQKIESGNISNNNPTYSMGLNSETYLTYPNIYYIILDAYARKDILRELYGFDNNDFISFLEDHGFYVASQSQANYSLTVCSLASSLNSQYLDEIKAKMGDGSSDKTPLIGMIWNSNIRRFLKNYGYKFITFSSGYYPTEIKDADQYVLSATNFEFESILLNRTLIGFLFRKQVINLEKRNHAERVLNILYEIPKVGKRHSPAFVFAHIVCPHPPFVFSKTQLTSDYTFADGSDLHFKKEDLRKKYIKAYTEQLIFINEKVKVLVTEILEQASVPPVIILQGDHGSRLNTEWGNTRDIDFKESIAIFNALYFRNNNKYLYENITPVNTFNIIIKEYFSQNVDLIRDKSFFVPGLHAPYNYFPIDDDMLNGNRFIR